MNTIVSTSDAITQAADELIQHAPDYDEAYRPSFFMKFMTYRVGEVGILKCRYFCQNNPFQNGRK